MGDRQRRVTIARFALARAEVTFAQWQVCVDGGGCRSNLQPDGRGWGRDDRPVINVSWNDAQEYITWLNLQTNGEPYHLPTGAEWEYAARAGSTTTYSWGNELGTNLANCAGCGSPWDDNRTTPVGSFAPNAWKLHDMHGNVREWVEDCWHGNYQGAPKDGRAWLSEQNGDCSKRVRRGGSLSSDLGNVRSAYRYSIEPKNRFNFLGFRPARTL